MGIGTVGGRGRQRSGGRNGVWMAIGVEGIRLVAGSGDVGMRDGGGEDGRGVFWDGAGTRRVGLRGGRRGLGLE